MPFFTVISDIGVDHGYTHLTQHEAASPAHAVASHLGQLPTDIADDAFIDFVRTFLDPSLVHLSCRLRARPLGLARRGAAPSPNRYLRHCNRMTATRSQRTATSRDHVSPSFGSLGHFARYAKFGNQDCL